MTKKQIKQSISGLIYSRLDEYQSRKNTGVKHVVFIEELKKEGFIVSPTVFNVLFHRATLKRNKNTNEPLIVASTKITDETAKVISNTSSQNTIKSVLSDKSVLSNQDITNLLNTDFDASKV